MMNHLLSSLILVFIGVGLWKRKQPRIHIPVMLAAFALDVALVLYIELSRHAIGTVVESVRTPDEHALLLFHVTVSLLVLVLYVILTWLGFKIVKGERGLLKLHRNLGGLFVLFRLTNYVTSFMV